MTVNKKRIIRVHYISYEVNSLLNKQNHVNVTLKIIRSS